MVFHDDLVQNVLVVVFNKSICVRQTPDNTLDNPEDNVATIQIGSGEYLDQNDKTIRQLAKHYHGKHVKSPALDGY